jgi:two-component system osmolarity sensor histidine kinase EnvZ
VVREAIEKVTPTPVVSAWDGLARWMNRALPKGLLARSLLIVVVPMVIFQTILAYVFMDRHWQLVTARLSAAVTRDIGAVVDLVEAAPPGADLSEIFDVARRRMMLTVELGPPETLPPPPSLGFTDPLIVRTLLEDLGQQLEGTYAVDMSAERVITVRTETTRGTLSIRFQRNLAYAANWHIFLVWMVVTALVLTSFAILFLRNQIKPIQRLAKAAEAFGRGRPVNDFVPQGAREVRRASQAFIAMRRRIERQIEQRTVMLAGVSHDLRTMLTRLRLGVAVLPPGDDAEAMARDLDDMESMLEAYMAYARGDPDEGVEPVDVAAVLADAAERHGLDGADISTSVTGARMPRLRPNGFKRLVSNLVGNAAKYGRTVAVSADVAAGWLTLTVDDDGPGIPEAARDQVFRPFVRLDDARNQNRGGAGLGLSIARDVARSHGGDIRIETGPLGGARVIARLQVGADEATADQ